MVGAQTANPSPPTSPRVDVDGTAQSGGESKAASQSIDGDARGSAASPDKYFIVKSLTLQDLELSVRNGIWATQSHNEDTLNKAFEVKHTHHYDYSASLTKHRVRTTCI